MRWRLTIGFRNLQRCLVCGLTVATRFGVHPTCRPTARAAGGSATTLPRPSGPSNDPLPTLAEIQCSNTPTSRHVPAGARHAWPSPGRAPWLNTMMNGHGCSCSCCPRLFCAPLPEVVANTVGQQQPSPWNGPSSPTLARCGRQWEWGWPL